MAGYRIEVMVDSTRITNKYRLQYETYFLSPTYAYIIETPEVSNRLKQEYNIRMRQLYEKGFSSPIPSGISQQKYKYLYLFLRYNIFDEKRNNYMHSIHIDIKCKSCICKSNFP